MIFYSFRVCMLLVVTALIIPAASENSSSGQGNEKGFLSVSAPRSSIGSVPSVMGDLYAVVVGVSRYAHRAIPPLNSPARDARDIGDFFQSQTNLFQHIHVSVLADEKASRSAIERELYYKLRRAGKDDTVIVFLSGHGADDPNSPGEFFFLSHDADPDFLAASAVHMNRQWFLSKLEARRVLILADSCHSGGFAGPGLKSVPSGLTGFLKLFRESEGKVFMTSSRADEYSREIDGMGNSLFSHFLLRGLRGEADPDGDGIITLGELYEYVYGRTKESSNGYQHPQMEGKVEGAFPLAVTMPTRTNIDPMDVRREMEGQIESSPEKYTLVYRVGQTGIEISLEDGDGRLKQFFVRNDPERLNELVERLRGSFHISNLDDLSRFDFDAAKTLGELLVGDIIEHIPSGIPLMIVPEGNLNLVPFESLLLSRAGRIIEKGPIPCIVDASFLGDRNPLYYGSFDNMKRPSDKSKRVHRESSRILFVGAPHFDTADLALFSKATHKLAALPEVEALGKRLKTSLQDQVEIYTGNDASKAQFLISARRNYDTFVLGTMGFGSSSDAGCESISPPEPILFFASRNQLKDMVLKSSEVATMDLPADMAILMACETGIGTPTIRGGNNSMGRSFLRAGVKSALVSLWPVEESASVKLVEAFVQERLKGKGKLEALQSARARLRASNYDHPFFWGGLVLIGSPD